MRSITRSVTVTNAITVIIPIHANGTTDEKLEDVYKRQLPSSYRKMPEEETGGGQGIGGEAQRATTGCK